MFDIKLPPVDTTIILSLLEIFGIFSKLIIDHCHDVELCTCYEIYIDGAPLLRFLTVNSRLQITVVCIISCF